MTNTTSVIMRTVGMICISRLMMYVRIGLLVQPDLVVVHLELRVVDVALHPRLRDHVEGRAGDGIPVEPVGAELRELLRDGLALRRIHLSRVAHGELVHL